MKEQNYKNKYFSIMGDSISTLAGCNPPDYNVFYEGDKQVMSGVYSPGDTWWGQVIEGLGGKLLVNNAFSGSLVCRHPACQIQSYGCSDERTSMLGKNGQAPDVVMVYLGTNDWGGGLGIRPCTEDDPLSVFSEAYCAMLEKIRRNYPQAEIWCFTLAVSVNRHQNDWHFPYSISGWHIEVYCDLIRTCAEKVGCRVIDLYKNAKPYDTIDGFHPSAEGMRTISEAVLEQLQKE